MVVIVVPAPVVPAIMLQCGKLGVKAVIIITAGFKEVGPEGLALEQRITQTAAQYGIRVIGPNCLGIIAPSKKINASFGGDLPAAGGIGYLSQSGALLAAILDMANASGIGFSKLVRIGNKIDVNELDLISALGDDPETKVIAGLPRKHHRRQHLRPPGRTDLQHQAHPADQIRRHGGRRQGRLEPHRQPGRRGNGVRGWIRTGRDHPLRFHRTAVRFCRSVRPAAAARREPGGGHHQRRRSRHHGGGRDRTAGAWFRPALAGDQRQARRISAGGSQHPQPGRRPGRCPGRPLRIRAGYGPGRPERGSSPWCC